MTNLTDLARRVSELQGPSREVDAEIMFDLYAKPCGVSKIDGGPSGYLWPEDNPSWNFGLRFPGRKREWFEEQRTRGDGERLLIERDGALVLMNSLRIPLLTASQDAAMTLARSDEEAFMMLSEAILKLEDAGWPHGEWVKHLPRFITAAALIARSEA